VFLIWFPILAEGRHHVVIESARALAGAAYLISQLQFPAEGQGLLGSGLVMVNPPWIFDRTVRAIEDALCGVLAGVTRAA
jgi:23S rRNA (adenine2030-N6)-methyltransferase